MAVHEIGPLTADKLREPVREREIEIAGAEEILDPDAVLARYRVDPRAGRADENIVVTALPQCIDEVHDLLRAAQKMASGFDMQYFHEPIIRDQLPFFRRLRGLCIAEKR